MDSSRVSAIVLLGLTVLPATVILALLVFVGFPFWVAGFADLVAGNYGWSEFEDADRPDVVLLFISGPLGLVGLVTLWVALLKFIRKRRIKNAQFMAVGLCCGILAAGHLLYLKVTIPLLLLPATLFMLYQVSRQSNGT